MMSFFHGLISGFSECELLDPTRVDGWLPTMSANYVMPPYHDYLQNKLLIREWPAGSQQ